MQIFNRTTINNEDEALDVGKMKAPSNTLTISEFNEICMEKLERILDNETFELIFYVFDKQTSLESVEIDFNLFARLFYLIYKKNELANFEGDDEFLINSEGNMSKSHMKEQMGENSLSKVLHENEENKDYEEEGEDYGDEDNEYY